MRTIVKGQYNKVYNEKDLPHTFISCIQQFNHDSNLQNYFQMYYADYLVYSITHSLTFKLEHLYNWANTRYKYRYRFSKVVSNNPDINSNKLTNYLKQRGVPIVKLHSAVWDNMSDQFAIWYKLQNRFGYDITNNTFIPLTTQVGVPVYLDNVSIEYSKYYINTVLFSFYSGSRIYNQKDPTGTFNVDINNISELKNKTLSFTHGKTYARNKNLNRSDSNYTISGYTSSNTYSTVIFDKSNPNSIKYVENTTGSKPSNTAHVTATFQYSKTTTTTLTKVRTYNNPAMHSAGYTDTAGTSTDVVTRQGNIANLPSGSIATNTVTTSRVLSETATKKTNNQDTIVRVTATTETKDYYHTFSFTYDDLVYSKHTTIDPEIIAYYNQNNKYVRVEPVKPVETNMKEYLQVVYLDNLKNLNLYWVEGGLTKNISLLSALKVKSITGQFYPTIPVKKNSTNLFINLKLDKNNEKYKSASEFKKLGNKITLNWKKLANGFYKATKDDAAKVRNSFLTFAVPIQAKDIESIMYLYEFCNYLYKKSLDANQAPLASGFAVGRSIYKGGVINLSDGYIDKVFSYGAVSYSKKVGRLQNTYEADDYDDLSGSGELLFIDDDLIYDDPVPLPPKWGYNSVTGYRVFRKQIDSRYYVEMILFDPIYKFVIDSSNRYAWIEPAIVPIGLMAKKLFNFTVREKLYTRNFGMVISTKMTTRKKWYQTGIFLVIIIIIIAVITYFFPPAGGWAASAAGAISGAAYGTTAYAIAAAAVAVTTSIVLTALSRVFGNSFIGKLIAIIAIIYGAYQIATSMVSAASVSFMRADWLVFVGRAGRLYLKLQKLQMMQLQNTVLARSHEFQDKMEALEKLEEQESTGTHIDYTKTSKDSLELGFIAIGESTDDMVARTLAVNTGQWTIDYISQMATIGVKLPGIENILKNVYNKHKQGELDGKTVVG